MRINRKPAAAVAVTTLVIAGALSVTDGGASAATKAKLPTVQRMDSSKAKFTEIGGGAPVLSTAKTVAHWHGTFQDPHDGVTYGYNMVGADPASDASSTVPTVMVPINLAFAGQGGYPLNGSTVAAPLAGSPVWTPNTYTQTGDSGVQYGDAVMRAQFNKLGSSGYHVQLGAPVMHTPVSFTVPAGQGFAAQITDGPVVGLVNTDWFASAITQLNNQLGIDPRVLTVYVTDNVLLYVQNNLDVCCVLGFHGASEVNGHGTGATHGNGNQTVQTFAWASYIRPGVFFTTDSPDDLSGSHYLQDIQGLSHEVSEWMDDPFVNNNVEPWLTPTAPQYGCTDVLETGDPVVGIGFHEGSNSFAQDVANGADGFWHPEDEVFLSWFARESPSRAYAGNYTFMGSANPFDGFHQPATGC